MDTVEQVFEKIMKEKKWEKQQLAEYIGYGASTLSQKLGRHWNLHWRVFVKLLPLMVQLKIITHEELYGTSDNRGSDGGPSNRDKDVKSQDNLPEKGPPINPIMSTERWISFVLQ